MSAYISNRTRTRDLLLEYSTIVPIRPRVGGLAMLYPWGNSHEFNPSQEIIGELLYNFAINSGFQGTREEFYNSFGLYLERNHQEVVFDFYKNFPRYGDPNKLYFDLDEHILYHWFDNAYRPVSTTLITNTILEGGDA